MNLTILESDELLGELVAKKIVKTIQEKPDAVICIAAGHSSISTMKAIKELFLKGEVSFSETSFVAMDEWKGMNKETPGSCGDFLDKNLFSKLNFKQENIYLFDGKSSDLQQECERMENTINYLGGIDLMIAGVGMNGHIALNEPGCDFDGGIHITELDNVTKQVGLKYFDNDSPNLTAGITIGLGNIKSSKHILVTINGERKADVLYKIVNVPINNEFPATVLRSLDNCEIICDKFAAGKLNT